MAITTYLQTKLTMPPSSSGAGGQSAAMGNMMSIYMPLLLGYFALNFASGLAVYFVTSNVLGIVQYAMMGQRQLAQSAAGREPAAGDAAEEEIGQGGQNDRADYVGDHCSDRGAGAGAGTCAAWACLRPPFPWRCWILGIRSVRPGQRARCVSA